MKKLACVALAVALCGMAAPALAQEVVYSAPTVTYYAPSVPVTTYYAPAPVTTFYAPAPVTTYYAPTTTYYAPAVVPTYSAYYAAPYFVPRWAYRRAVRWGW